MKNSHYIFIESLLINIVLTINLKSDN